MQTKIFDTIIMLRFGQTKVGKGETYATKKRKVWDIDVGYTAISKLNRSEIITCI